MCINDFIKKYRKYNPKGHFFDRVTLLFWHSEVSKMKVLDGTFKVVTSANNVYECYAIEYFFDDRHHQRKTVAYFDTVNYKHILGKVV